MFSGSSEIKKDLAIKRKIVLKILLATDGSANSKAAVEDVARRPFPSNTKVRIVSAYERVCE